MGFELSRPQYIALCLIPSILLAVFLTPIANYLSFEQQIALSLIACAITLFATSALPEHLTALLFMVSVMLLGVAPANVIFSGFNSTACWLIFSGMIIGIAIKQTGLAKRIGACFSQYLDANYTALIGGVVILSTLLGFLMPSSMGRAILFIPIAMAVAEQCGFKPGSNGHTGVALAAAFGCHVPTFAVLPANVPNMVMVGASETIHGWTPGYTEYLLLHFPLLGFIKAGLIIAFIVKLYPDSPKRSAAHEASDQFSFNEKKLLIILIITLVFWLTDSLHHISAAWIGLASACFLMLPSIGLVDQKSLNTQFNISSLIFVVGILGLGALINDSGLGKVLGEFLNEKLPLSADSPFINYVVLSLTGVTTGVIATLPGVSAILTPMAEQFSSSSGFDLDAVLMMQVIGFSTIVFPFQSAPLIVGMQLAKVPLIHAAKLCLWLTAVTLIFLMPLDYLWWRLLGWI